MKQLAIALWAAQAIAVVVMLIATMVDVEYILFTGPTLAVIGLLHALVTSSMRSWTTLLVALSAPLISALISLLIAVFHWSPGEAHDPVVTIVGVYLFLIFPMAFLSLRRIWQWQRMAQTFAPPWQFSLRSLLILMTGVCVLIVAGKLVAGLRHEALFLAASRSS